MKVFPQWLPCRLSQRPQVRPGGAPAYPAERAVWPQPRRLEFFRYPQTGCSRARIETLFGRGGRYRLGAEGLP
jgi:hypothetical protein